MTVSSVSTYLDVTQATNGSQAPSGAQTSDPGTETAAKVLAAIRDGEQVVAQVPAKTGLPIERVLATVAWLSENGLIAVEESDGTLRAQLTEPAKAALDQS